MKEVLQAIAAKQGGVVLRPQALTVGYNSDEISYLLRRGEWVAVRRGAYVDREAYERMSVVDLHRAKVHATARSVKAPIVVSHVSAAVMHDLPTWGLDLSEVHVSRAGLHSSRLEAGVRHHRGEIRPDDVVVIDGIKVMSLARTVIDTARITPFEPSVVVADAAFARDPALQALTLARLDDMRDWQGSRNAGAVVAFADGRSGSVGESRSRVMFHNVGLPKPKLQVEFRTTSGLLVAIVDFYFEEFRTIGEFDGKQKYLGFLRPGETPGDAVWREKRREDSLRRLGNEVERVIWPDLYRPWDVERRFRAAFARGLRHP